VIAALVKRRPIIFPLVVIAYFATSAVVDVLKLSIHRQRPVDHTLVPEPTSSSFPSGHAATSFACAATLAPFVSRTGAIVLYVLAAGIAYSRVYVGVHYPIDVLAGAALGLLVATALRRLQAALQRSRQSPTAG
jgi:membrane-associated phospholipid phosphatase